MVSGHLILPHALLDHVLQGEPPAGEDLGGGGQDVGHLLGAPENLPEIREDISYTRRYAGLLARPVEGFCLQPEVQKGTTVRLLVV